MVQLLVKSLTAPIISSVLLFFMTGSFMILAGEASGGDKIIKLPDPDREGTIPLETTLQKRRSVRSYQDDLLTLHTVSQTSMGGPGDYRTGRPENRSFRRGTLSP
jgi:hypothetical protein